ncbi:MAG: hypothetical protein H0U76_02875 [Ktedonobacteraceae bacterium]|nr:hypothetical protein [Ktedonobacteraceae bacterium]MBA3824320.1 hypothetical protein [Ktedonobacterales bacterium]
MSHQLQNCIARDKLEFPQAHYAFRKAHEAAIELGNEEFLAAALAREGVTYIQERNPREAIKHLSGAINCIHYKGLPNLKGHILQALAEAHSMAGNSQESWRNLGLAERALESLGDVPEYSLARFNAASITAHRGIVAAQLKEHSYAITLLNKSLMGYDPTMIRDRARLLAQKAEAFLGLERIEECAATAEEAVTLARSVRSNRTITLIESISDSLRDSRWRKEPSVARLHGVLAI